MVYKASLKRRAGIEIFDIEQIVKPEEPCQVVAVKVLQGNCSHRANLRGVSLFTGSSL